MINLTVLHPYVENKKFDMDYYLNVHIPHIKAIGGKKIKNIYIEKGLSGLKPNSPPSFKVIIHLSFESKEDCEELLAKVGKLPTDDTANFTEVTPILQISEIKL